MRTLDASQRISIVAPLYNEQRSVADFVGEVRRALDALELPCAHELVLVDDGSTDDTFSQLQALARQHPDEIRVLRLSRNFGLSAAISAGLRHARGNLVILMDADMQDDPAAFGAFIEKWREGYDVVYAIRSGRQESRVIRALTWFFYRALHIMAQVPLPLDAGNFALMDRCVVDILTALPENNRYLPGLRSWVGFRQMGIEVRRRKREHGASRMGLRKLYDLAIMALFSFSFMPLFLFRFLGVAALLVALLLTLVSPLLLLSRTMSWPLALALFAIAFFGGVNLLGISILGEYVALIYDEVRQRPPYVVAESLNCSTDGQNRSEK